MLKFKNLTSSPSWSQRWYKDSISLPDGNLKEIVNNYSTNDSKLVPLLKEYVKIVNESSAFLK